MGEAVEPPHMTEPEPVDCHFVEFVAIEVRDEFVRIVGAIDLETVQEGMPPERRIVVRAAMPLTVAKALIRDLRHVLVRGAN